MGVNNLRRKHGFIAAAAAHGSNSPACIDNQKKRRRDCEPPPDSAGWKSSQRAPGAETGKDLLAKRGRRSLIELRQAHGRAQSLQVLECVHTLRALFQMAFECCGACGIQFVIEVAVHNGPGAVTDHGLTPCSQGQSAPAEAVGGHEKAWT